MLSDVDVTRTVSLGQICDDVGDDFWHVFVMQSNGFA
jgi:hypothetical protein